MSSQPPSLLLYNVNVITLEPSLPRASWVAVAGDSIAEVGRGDPPRELLGRQGVRAVDCGGGVLIPGFHDAHCHVLATASALLAVDCSPGAVSSVKEIGERLMQRAAVTPPGAWIRGAGYNEFYLRERRYPDRHDLDSAVPDRPVRLAHRSGHAHVLNTRALELAGIHADTPDPVDGVIERDPATGEPTGLLLEMGGYLDGVVPALTREDLYEGVRFFNAQCLSMGITSLQDATHTNTPERWRLFKDIRERGFLTPEVTLMAGAAHLPEFLREGFAFGCERDGIRLGAAKIMLTMTTGSLSPSMEELAGMVESAARRGFPVAIHAVEVEAVEAGVEAICRLGQGTAPGLRHRIEHCSECPPWLADRLAGCGITVVTQPGFIYHHGDRYLAEVDEERQPWLYTIGSLRARGVRVGAGSDAPVAAFNPLDGIYAAVTRKSSSGAVLLPSEAVDAHTALRMHTLDSACTGAQGHVLGSIAMGKRADLALLDRDPTAIDPEEIRETKALMTVVGGRVVWEG